MDVVAVGSLKTLCVKSLGPTKLRESVALGLAPQELFVEPYKPQKKNFDENSENTNEDIEKLPEVFRVKLCASLSEIKEIYGEYHAHDLEESSLDMSYEDEDDDEEEYEDDDEDEDGGHEGVEDDMEVDWRQLRSMDH